MLSKWETTVPVSDVPWLQSRRGKATIVGFFESMAPLKITRFEPQTIFDGGYEVFVLITFELRSNKGHLWQFNAAGKVVKYDHVTGTAQMIRVAKGNESANDAVTGRLVPLPIRRRLT